MGSESIIWRGGSLCEFLSFLQQTTDNIFNLCLGMKLYARKWKMDDFGVE